MPTRQVLIVTYPGIQSLDVVGPYEVFASVAAGTARQGGPPAYRLRLVSPGGRPVTAESGITIDTEPCRRPPRSTTTRSTRWCCRVATGCTRPAPARR
ncbi:MAG: hypothetical protein R2694_09600 [Ilumatobacteraceae bacterium]